MLLIAYECQNVKINRLRVLFFFMKVWIFGVSEIHNKFYGKIKLKYNFYALFIYEKYNYSSSCSQSSWSQVGKPKISVQKALVSSSSGIYFSNFFRSCIFLMLMGRLPVYAGLVGKLIGSLLLFLNRKVCVIRSWWSIGVSILLADVSICHRLKTIKK